MGFTQIILAVFGLILIAFGFALGMRYENHLMFRRLNELAKLPEPCCGNCKEYDGSRCMKEWNNLDESYYFPDRDDKEPEDVCDDWEFDEDLVEE